MPTYHVTSPDGHSYEINAPEGASEDEVMAYAQEQFTQPQGGGAPPANATPSQPNATPAATPRRPLDLSAAPTGPVLEHILTTSIPGLKVTSRGRTDAEQQRLINEGYPAAPVGRTYHAGFHALDFVAPKGTTEATLRETLKAAGIEADEVKFHNQNGSWHVGLGKLPEGYHMDPATSQAILNRANHDGASPDELIAFAKSYGLQPEDEKKFRDVIARRGDVAVHSQSDAPAPTQEAKADDQGPGLMARLGTSVIEGLPDALTNVANMGVGMALNHFGIPINNVDLGAGEPVRNVMHNIGIGQTGDSYKPQSTPERYAQDAARFAGSAIIPEVGLLGRGALLRRGAKEATNLIDKVALKAAERPLASAGMAAGGSVGGSVAGDAAYDATGNEDAKTLATIVGGVAGGAGPGVARRGVSNASDALYARGRIKDPNAPFAHEVVEDLANVSRQNVAPGSSMMPKGRSKLTVKQVNDVERTYTTGFKEKLGALEIPEGQKRDLVDAIEQRGVVSPERLAEIRQLPHGNAVADAIQKVQVLRKLTPEVPPKSRGVLLEAAGAGLGTMTSGPAGGIVMPLAIRGLRTVLRKSPGAEAARVNSAERLINREGAWQKIGEKVGPSGQRESQAGLNQAYKDAVAAKEADAATNAADRASKPTKDDLRAFRTDLSTANPDPSPFDSVIGRGKKALTKVQKVLDKGPDALHQFDEKLNQPTPEATIRDRDRKGLRRDIADPAPDPRDIQFPQRSEKQIATRIQSRNAALAKMEGKLNAFDPEAPAPVKPTKTKEPSPADKVIQAQYEQGVEGPHRAGDTLASSLGVTRADLMRGLDTLSKDPTFAPLADDFARLRKGYSTTGGKTFQAVAPALKRTFEADGTYARLKAEADKVTAAKEQAAATAKANKVGKTGKAKDTLPPLQNPAPLEANPNPASSIEEVLPPSPVAAATEKSDYKPVGRQKQWEQGKERIVQAQRDVADQMYLDTKVPKNLQASMHEPLETIITKHRTQEDAMRYFDEDVVPDLRAEGFSEKDMATAREYAHRVSEQKRYLSNDDFENNVKRRKPGRPKTKD